MVSRHYRIPNHEEPIGQGDIFLNVPVPVTLFERQLVWDPDTTAYRAEAVEGDLAAGMHFLTRIEIKHAIVLDQSCDAPRATRILLAPLAPFTPEGKEDVQWKHISRLATSLADPTRFYLPDEPSCGLGRHLAEFENKCDLPGVFLRKLLTDGKRVLSLSQEALAFFQFRLGTLFSRLARDDYAWPSVADLELKQGYLSKQIEGKEGEIKGWRNKADKEDTPEGEKERLRARITIREREVGEMREDLARCAEAIREQEQPPAPVQAQPSTAEVRLEEVQGAGENLAEGARAAPTLPQQPDQPVQPVQDETGPGNPGVTPSGQAPEE